MVKKCGTLHLEKGFCLQNAFFLGGGEGYVFRIINPLNINYALFPCRVRLYLLKPLLINILNYENVI